LYNKIDAQGYRRTVNERHIGWVWKGLAGGASDLVELGCTILLTCACVQYPGSFPNIVLWGLFFCEFVM
jgi:hypothetical protein